MKSWHQFSFNVNQDRVDAVEDVMLNIGAVSVTLQDAQDQPLLEPLPGETPTWDHSIMTCLFEQNVSADHLEQAFQVPLLRTELNSLTYELIQDQDWERAWMDNFKPMQFGQRLWVVPSHMDAPNPDAVNMALDPGLAFGTGTHPTTALCLRWLDSLALTQSLNNHVIMDFGCGSGILAIAGLLLGAKCAYVTDIDPQAIDATKANSLQNHVDDKINVLDTDQTPEEKIDIFIANILAGPLEALASQFAELCQPGTRIALSGILSDQADALQSHYSHWFDMNEAEFEEDWGLLTGVRKG